MLGFFSIFCVVVCIVIMAVSIQSAVNLRKAKPDDPVGKQSRDLLEDKEALRYLNIYTSAFRTMNVNTLYSTMTDFMYHSTATAIQGFAKLGVRKEIDFELDPKQKSYAGELVSDDGKLVTSASHIYCSRYRERLVDTVSNAVLHTYEAANVDIILHLSRSIAKDTAETKYCSGCGAPLQTNGEIFVCQHCGATYTSDSYDWMISAYSTFDNKKANALYTPIGCAAFLLFFALPIMGFCSSNNPGLAAIVTALDLLLVAAAGIYAGVVRKVYRGLKQLKDIDPLSPDDLVQHRGLFLISIFYSACNFNLNLLKPFMDSNAYAELLAAYRPSGSYVLSTSTTGMGAIEGLRIENGRQILSVNLTLKLTVLDRNRTIQVIKRKVFFEMYRNEHVRYEHKLSSESFTCKGCGMSVNLTANGKCKYCGTEYDIADYDWKLGRIDFNACI